MFPSATASVPATGGQDPSTSAPAAGALGATVSASSDLGLMTTLQGSRERRMINWPLLDMCGTYLLSRARVATHQKNILQLMSNYLDFVDAEILRDTEVQ